MMKSLKMFVITTAAVVSLCALSAFPALAAGTSSKPTIVLVHGAFADSSSWDKVSEKLVQAGYIVIGAANPLRGVASDGAYIGSIVKSIDGPIVLVGHSYGGNVISAAAADNSNVRSLVYVAGLAPDIGESAASISTQFPGSTLGPTLSPAVGLLDGGKDLYIKQSKFPDQFAADVPLKIAKLMAINQRPITEAALNEPARVAAWKSIPSFFVYGSLDKNITPAAHAFMAKRAKSRQTMEVKGASHVVMISHPDVVAKLIEEASAVK